MTVIKSDKKAIFRAAADAQRVADYILGFHPDYAAAVRAANEAGAEKHDGDGDPGDTHDECDDQAGLVVEPLATAA